MNKSGFVCHGPLDRDAIGPGAKKVPYICNEIQQQTMSMIYLGIPEESVLEKHIEGIQRYGGSHAAVNSHASQYVHKLGMIIKRSTHELDLDDQASIRLWIERNRKSIFFYQDASETDSFILGIQSEWQLQQMVRFGQHSLIAADSTFGIKRLKVDIHLKLISRSSGISIVERTCRLILSCFVCSIPCARFLCLIQDSTHCLLHGLSLVALQSPMYRNG